MKLKSTIQRNTTTDVGGRTISLRIPKMFVRECKSGSISRKVSSYARADTSCVLIRSSKENFSYLKYF